MTDLVERLRARTKRTLPNDWKKGRQCPECDSSADRPKCFFDMGAACPRHDPDNYEPSPYVIVPDLDCKDAADIIEQLEAEIARKDALMEKVAQAAIDAAAEVVLEGEEDALHYIRTLSASEIVKEMCGE